MSDRAVVPCNGCTACCQNDLLVLHPELGDDPTQYETMKAIHPLTGEPVFALAHKPEGSCVYLGKNGCTIWHRAPAICREFDCRRLFRQTTRAERRRAVRQGFMSKDVIKAARARLHTLEIDE